MSPGCAGPGALCVSINVNGLGARGKLGSLVSYLARSGALVAFIQETKIRRDADSVCSMLPGLSTLWPGVQIFCSPGAGHSKGLLTILSPSVTRAKQSDLDGGGRVLRVDACISGHQVALVNVYAPSNPSDRDAFFAALPQHLPSDGGALLLGGDFNCVVTPALDCVYASGVLPARNTRVIGSLALSNIMRNHQLVDVWRRQNGNRQDFTHFSKLHASGARLDRWLVSDSALQCFRASSNIEATPPGLGSDHLPVSLRLRLLSPPLEGRGMRSFPLPLLNDAEDVQAMRSYLEGLCAQLAAVPDDRLIGEYASMKAALLSAAGRWHRAAQRQRTQRLRALDAKAACARVAFVQAVPPPSEPLQPQRGAGAWGSSQGPSGSPGPGSPAGGSEQFEDCPIEGQGAVGAGASGSAATAGGGTAAAGAGTTAASGQWGTAGVQGSGRAWQQARDEAATAWQQEGSREARTAAVLDHHFGDGPSYLFHAQTRLTHKPCHIDALCDPLGGPDADLSTLGGVATAQRYAVSYYSSASAVGLFRQKQTDQAAQQTLLGSLRRSLPPLLADAAEGPGGDGLVAESEVMRALSSAGQGSAPGTDGLPYEFFRVFRQQLAPVLTRVFNVAFKLADHPEPLAPLLPGVICLVPKPGNTGAAVRSLANYRPITLLNADIKLLMLIMSARLQRPLDYLVDISQSAFLTGRDIGDNVRYHLGLSSRLQDLGLPGWLLLSDLQKAYDSVDRSYLLMVMVRMGFRTEGMLRWTQILFGGTSARVRVNGFLSDSFPITSSLAQGASVSCQHWAIVLQPLVSYLQTLQASGRVASVMLPSGAVAPASQEFADDIKVLLVDPDTDGPAVREAFLINQRASGVGQSAKKSFLIHLAGDVPATLDPQLKVHAATGYNLVPDSQQQRLLGVPFSADQPACASAAFSSMAAGMQAAARKWSRIPIGQFGRVYVAMSCLASKAAYQASFQQPSSEQVTAMQKVVNQYAAGWSLPTEQAPYKGCLYPRQEIATLSVSAGGLGLPLIGVRCAANLTKTIWRSFCQPCSPAADLIRGELARAVPAGHSMPPGAQWLLAADAAAVSEWTQRIASPSVRAAATAFSQVRLRRIMQPEQQEWESVMVETTFHNGVTSVGVDSLQTSEAAQWRRLRDVRAAHQQREQLPAAQLADLQLILAGLPTAWHSAVTGPSSPSSQWVVLSGSPEDIVWLEGPDPATGQTRVWEAAQTGLLERMNSPFVRGPEPGLPALVVLQPRHKRSWDSEDRAFHEEQAALPAQARQRVMQPRLLGLWEGIDVDPRVWGMGGDSSLLQLSVQMIRQALEGQHRQEAAAAAPDVEGVGEYGAVWPAIWRREAHQRGLSGHVAGPSGAGEDEGQGNMDPTEQAVQGDGRDAPSPQLAGQVPVQDSPALVTPPVHPILETGPGPPGAASMLAAAADAEALDGLKHLERRWQETARQGIYSQEGNADDPPAWQRPAAAPRVHPVERAQQRLQREPATPRGGLRPDFQAVWRRLQDRTLHRPHRLVCWRVLHGQLGCNAFLHHVNPSLFASNCCSAPACRQQRCVETLTHAFLECPEVRPAVEWLQQTWEQLAGERYAVPLTPAFLLADDPEGWVGADDGRVYRQWTRLRVAFLGALWEARCSRGGGGGGYGVSLARRVAQATAACVVAAVWRDWLRTSGGRAWSPGWFCADWWRDAGFVLPMQLFRSSWLKPAVFCELRGGGLSLRLGVNEPVQLPA